MVKFYEGKKLTVSDVLEIRELATHGVTLSELAEWYNVKYNTIYSVITRRTWRYAEEYA